VDLNTSEPLIYTRSFAVTKWSAWLMSKESLQVWGSKPSYTKICYSITPHSPSVVTSQSSTQQALALQKPSVPSIVEKTEQTCRNVCICWSGERNGWPRTPGYFLTYLITPWCRVLFEKLTGLQLVKKFTAFHGTRKFITALTNVRQLSLSWASPIQSIYPHSSSWRSILILSTLLSLGLPSVLLPSGFPTKTLYTPSTHPYAPHTQPISFFSILLPAQYWVRSAAHLAPRYVISSIPPLPRPS